MKTFKFTLGQLLFARFPQLDFQTLVVSAELETLKVKSQISSDFTQAIN